MEIWDIWAKMGPFWAPGGPEGTQYQVKVSGDHESNPGGPMGGSWDQIWSPGGYFLYIVQKGWKKSIYQ